MNWVYALIALVFCVASIPLWAAMWRDPKRRSRGGASVVMSELNAIFDPSHRSVQEAKQIAHAERENDEPPPP